MNLKSPKKGEVIKGTYEVLFGTALGDAEIVGNAVQMDYSGATDVDYNSQETLRENFMVACNGKGLNYKNAGERLFADSAGCIWTEKQVIAANRKPRKRNVT